MRILFFIFEKFNSDKFGISSKSLTKIRSSSDDSDKPLC